MKRAEHPSTQFQPFGSTYLTCQRSESGDNSGKSAKTSVLPGHFVYLNDELKKNKTP
jgi:hypothetical protein